MHLAEEHPAGFCVRYGGVGNNTMETLLASKGNIADASVESLYLEIAENYHKDVSVPSGNEGKRIAGKDLLPDEYGDCSRSGNTQAAAMNHLPANGRQADGDDYIAWTMVYAGVHALDRLQSLSPGTLRNLLQLNDMKLKHTNFVLWSRQIAVAAGVVFLSRRGLRSMWDPMKRFLKVMISPTHHHAVATAIKMTLPLVSFLFLLLIAVGVLFDPSRQKRRRELETLSLFFRLAMVLHTVRPK
jgi:hypothetical protein